MRIAVIADTHDRLPAFLPTELASADEIWHLGDVCDPTVLDAFADLRPPLRIVLGNNDDNPRWPLFLNLTREGVRFHLIHIPPHRAPLECDAVLHGHTHVPRDDQIGRVRWLNPGCISRPNRGAPPSFAWMTVQSGQIVSWKLRLLG